MLGLLDIPGNNTCATGAVAGAVIALAVWGRRKTRRSYPPGPRGYPIVGNYFDWPKGNIWEGFVQLTDEYSEYTFD